MNAIHWSRMDQEPRSLFLLSRLQCFIECERHLRRQMTVREEASLLMEPEGASLLTAPEEVTEVAQKRTHRGRVHRWMKRRSERFQAGPLDANVEQAPRIALMRPTERCCLLRSPVDFLHSADTRVDYFLGREMPNSSSLRMRVLREMPSSRAARV